MSESLPERWAERLAITARALPYPPTPDIAAVVTQRLALGRMRRATRYWQAALVASILIVLGLLAVPSVRATVIEVLRIGAVRIFLVPPTPTATPTSAPTPTGTLLPAAIGTLGPTTTPSPTPTPLLSVLDLAGQTTLADARAKANFTVVLPTYPSDLGDPQAVFVQDLGAPAVILAWVDPRDPARVRMSLHEIGPGSWVLEKMGFSKQGFSKEGLANSGLMVIDFATVNGQTAVWVQGPHILVARNGQFEQTRLVSGNTLIWVDDHGVTYRLETDQTLAEAVKIAESLK
jgi:hypothetical protein